MTQNCWFGLLWNCVWSMGMKTVISWNIAKRSKPWRELFDMQADVALLQEVGSLPEFVPQGVEFDPSDLWDPWAQGAYDRWPTVVKLSDKVKVDWFRRYNRIWCLRLVDQAATLVSSF